MKNEENNHHDGIKPIEPIYTNSMEANLNKDNISQEQIEKVTENTIYNSLNITNNEPNILSTSTLEPITNINQSTITPSNDIPNLESIKPVSLSEASQPNNINYNTLQQPNNNDNLIPISKETIIPQSKKSTDNLKINQNISIPSQLNQNPSTPPEPKINIQSQPSLNTNEIPKSTNHQITSLNLKNLIISIIPIAGLIIILTKKIKHPEEYSQKTDNYLLIISIILNIIYMIIFVIR